MEGLESKTIGREYDPEFFCCSQGNLKRIKEVCGNAREKIKNGFMPWYVDSASRILFYVAPVGVWEKIGAGMDWKEVAISRGIATGINVIGAARLYTFGRKFLARKTNTDESSSKTRKKAVDFSLQFLVNVFKLGIYAGILYTAGADLKEGLIASPVNLAWTSCSGHWYGEFNDWMRRKHNLPGILYKQKILK